MADDLEGKRAQLEQSRHELEMLERSSADIELIRQHRALCRQLADQIADIERQEGERPTT